MPLTPLLYRYLTILWQSSSGSKEELGIFAIRWKWLFWCKIRFRRHKIQIHINRWEIDNKKAVVLFIHHHTLTKIALMHFSKISFQNKLLIVDVEELCEWQLKLTPFSSIGVVYQVGRIGGLPNGNTNRGKCRPSPPKSETPTNNILDILIRDALKENW